MFIRLVLTFALLSLSGLTASAQSFMPMTFGTAITPGDEVESPNEVLISGDLISSVQSYQKGSPFFLSYNLKVKSPWHAYFRNPASVGLPLEIALTAPVGFEIEGPYWSVPKRIEGAIGVSYSYEKASFVWLITALDDAPAKSDFQIKAMAQLCNDEGCAPPSDLLDSLSLSMGDGAPSSNWNQEEAKVEVIGDSSLQVAAEQKGDKVYLSFQTDASVKDAYFFSNDNSIDPTKAQVISQVDDIYTLELSRNMGEDPMYPAPSEPAVDAELTNLSGILRWDDKHRSIDLSLVGSLAVEESNTAALTPNAASTSSMPIGFLEVILALFLGGLILNLMPCVFPVIGLKIMSFVKLSGGSHRKVLMHSGSFVLGVLISFWLLSLGLITLSKIDVLAQLPWTEWFSAIINDQGSSARSWAVWMQNPWIVYVLTLVLLVLGLSMYGLFEVGISASGAGQKLTQNKGYSGSFFSGLLATVVATPCSAPFLGASLPAAMAMPALWLILAMSFMAIGLAFPYIVIGIFPSLLRFLPRPGAWMESMKQGLSFLLFAAVAWLIYAYLAFVPVSLDGDIPFMLIGLVVISAAFWVYGRWCPMYKSMTARLIGGFFAMALLVAGIIMSMPRSQEAIVAGEVRYEWQTWSQSAVDAALAEGKPVFVDFTAKWCATCIYNKKIAYTEEVLTRMQKDGIVLMRADKTQPNAAIDAELQKLKRTSVPVNVLYVKDKQPVITKVMLNPSYLMEFLDTNLDKKKD